MSDSNPSDFPVLFTVGASNRHDVLLLNPGMSLSDINAKLEKTIASSPNCAQALDKYSKNKNPQEVQSVRVRWSGEPRGARLWPSATLLTEENAEAVLRLVALHQGTDVLEVEATQQPLPAEEEKKEEEGEGKEGEGEGEAKEGEKEKGEDKA